MSEAPAWICCHLGAREHYAIPRALHGGGRLQAMITDAWVSPGSAWSLLPGAAGKRLSERWHPDLAEATVHAFTASFTAREAAWRLQADGWPRLMQRNAWFGRRSGAALRSLRQASPRPGAVVFAHSYSAREVFTAAKSLGCTTVMGQIDPGPAHFENAERAALARPEYGPPPLMPPAEYFDSWRIECSLADHIVVNSEWSRQLLQQAGVQEHKLRVVPLVYASPTRAMPEARVYPMQFSQSRPLRVLFVGHVSVVKGAAALLEAMKLLEDVPIELRLVGATAMQVPPEFSTHQAIRWIGPVSRSDVLQHYRDSDVLVFASLSDGFGMAQIEAQGEGLPVVASRSCGSVVTDGVNGMLLDEPSPRAIAGALRQLAGDSSLLQRFSRSASPYQGTLPALAAALVDLAQ